MEQVKDILSKYINSKHIIASLILVIGFYIITIWRPANLLVIILLFTITLNIYLMKIESECQNKFDKNIKPIINRIDKMNESTSNA